MLDYILYQTDHDVESEANTPAMTVVLTSCRRVLHNRP